jgi:cellobiose epimerase
MKKEVEQYRSELENELEALLRYWMSHAPDEENGGFVGRIDHNETVHPGSPKGSVLNSRILWSFSAAYCLTKKEAYLSIAERAFHYLIEHFLDKEHGGVYWTVDYKGRPLDTKKQIYALAFAIYGFSEYHRACSNKRAKELSIQLYNDIVAHSYDKVHGGYIEALARDWKEIDDLRLSAKDANERKSMNTHLHVLEGFANLYRIWPDEGLNEKIRELIQLFLNYIICPETSHLSLFFDDEWNPKSNITSYGHDIEAAWLIQEAAEIIEDDDLLKKAKEYSVRIADAAARGLDKDGGLWSEYDGDANHLIRQKHWWPQAEAMVGFLAAWQNTGNDNFLEKSLRSWEFVKQYIRDKKAGEWVWGVYEDYSVMCEEDKVGLWKCPYHNSRACIEIISRISTLTGVASVESKTEANKHTAI